MYMYMYMYTLSSVSESSHMHLFVAISVLLSLTPPTFVMLPGMHGDAYMIPCVHVSVWECTVYTGMLFVIPHVVGVIRAPDYNLWYYSIYM